MRGRSCRLELAYRAIPLEAAYCASKHAIRAFTEKVRTELFHDGSKVRITIVQLQGLNMPHFTPVRSRMKSGVRPVPLIYTPELAACAVGYAADHPIRREYVVGALTEMMVLGSKAAPGLLGRYLAATGFSSQPTSSPMDPRDENLFVSSQGDPGASGPFADEARDRSIQWFLSRHGRLLGLAGVIAAIKAVKQAS